jgi:hypothetical protein
LGGGRFFKAIIRWLKGRPDPFFPDDEVVIHRNFERLGQLGFNTGGDLFTYLGVNPGVPAFEVLPGADNEQVGRVFNVNQVLAGNIAGELEISSRTSSRILRRPSISLLLCCITTHHLALHFVVLASAAENTSGFGRSE